jgi:hypothetical protein
MKKQMSILFKKEYNNMSSLLLNLKRFLKKEKTNVNRLGPKCVKCPIKRTPILTV